jgi:hypothetical protein
MTLSSRRAVAWVFAAALSLSALVAGVSPQFRVVRINVVVPPAPDGRVAFVPLAGADTFTGSRVVLVCRLRNLGRHPLRVEARFGGVVLAHAELAPAEVRRLDAVLSRSALARAAGRVELTGTSGDWRIEDAELSNAHGFSRGVLNLAVPPAGQAFERVPMPVILLCAGCVLLLGWTGSVHAPAARTRLLSRIMSGAGVLPLGAVLVSPYLTPFRIVLEPRTFVLLVLLVWNSRLVSLARRLEGAWKAWSSQVKALPALACGLLGAAFFASGVVHTLAGYGGNYSGFLHLSKEVAARAPFLREEPELAESLMLYDEGYDGQFMFLMAFDPLLRRFRDEPSRYRAFVDFPPYRYGRIGFSLLTRLASGGRPARFARP